MSLRDATAHEPFRLPIGQEFDEGGLMSDELLDTLVALFNTYDRRARVDLDHSLPPRTLDREIFQDLLEGPAAPYVDTRRSSAEHHLIAFTDGSGARRRLDGQWERTSLDQTSFFDRSVEIRLDIHELG